MLQTFVLLKLSKMETPYLIDLYTQQYILTSHKRRQYPSQNNKWFARILKAAFSSQ